MQGLKRIEQRRWDGVLLIVGPFALPLLLDAVLPPTVPVLLQNTVLPGPLPCEGGVELLMLGVLLYFFRRDKRTQLTAYVVGTLVMYLTPVVLLGGFTLVFAY